MNSKIIKFVVLPAILIVVVIFIFVHSQKNTANIVTTKDNVQADTSDINTPDNEPYIFKGRSPQNIRAGEQVSANFSLTNNQSIPIIQIRLEFKNTDGIKIIPNTDWKENDEGLEKDNIFLKRGQTLNDSFSFKIDQPGTYQFEIIPKVQAGDLQEIGTYVISVNVNDSPEAQQQRDNQAKYKQVCDSLDQIDSKIQDMENEICTVQNEIARKKTLIDAYQQDIRYQQQRISSGNPYAASDANVQIQNYNQKIQDENNAINQYQSQLNQLNANLNNLEAEQQSLESQKSDVQSKLSESN